MEKEALDPQQQAQLEALQKDTVARRTAAGEPFPGPLRSAFAAGPQNLHGLKLRPVVASDFILLRRLESPLYRQSQALIEHRQKISAGLLPENAPEPKTDFQEEEAYEMIYQFSVPVQQARADLNKGREHFRETSLRAIADRFTPLQVPDLVQGIVANFLAAFSTVIRQSPAKEGGQDENFQTRPAAQPTASDGGSTTSPS